MAQKVRSCGIITLGAVIYALAFDWFVAPNQIAMGGVTGLAQIVNALVPVLPVGVLSILVNVPLFGRPPAGEQPVRHGSQFLGH